MKTNQRRLYNHIITNPISKEQTELSNDIKLNKLGSYKNQEDET